ncbi:MAG: hypothetical protein K2Q26_09345 [Bdellovibrionales bacterium]|nr:hypothetical protein [Bdellovibrionales bacterium]
MTKKHKNARSKISELFVARSACLCGVLVVRLRAGLARASISKILERALVLLVSCGTFGVCFEAWGVEAKPSLKVVKELIGRRKIAEASELLRLHGKEWIRTAQQRQDVNQWMSVFVTDEGLGLFEKAVEKLDSDNEAAINYLEKAMALEPYNRLVSTFLISRLMNPKEVRAREILELKLSQQPYLSIFQLYKVHLELLAKGSPATMSPIPKCEAQLYDSNEMDYCHLLQMMWWVKQTPKGKSNGAQAAKVIKNYSQQIKNPEAFYWLWQWSGHKEDLKNYLSKCQGLSTKDKKAYGGIPGVCFQQKMALEQLDAAEE